MLWLWFALDYHRKKVIPVLWYGARMTENSLFRNIKKIKKFDAADFRRVHLFETTIL